MKEEWEEEPQVSRLCDLAPTSTKSSDICQTTTKIVKVIEERGNDAKDYMYYQWWWVSNGQPCH